MHGEPKSGEIILHRIISVVCFSSLPQNLRQQPSYDDEEWRHSLSVKLGADWLGHLVPANRVLMIALPASQRVSLGVGAF